MNLGQAVAVCLYELLRNEPPAGIVSAVASGASAEERENLTQLLFTVLRASGYIKPRMARAQEEKLRRLVHRMHLDKRDATLWLGMLRQIAWKLTLRAPEIDLEQQGIPPARIALNDPLQWGVGYEAPVPIVLAIDLDGGKAGWQCPARHDVLWPNRMGFCVEVDEIARPHIDGAGAVTRDAGIETIKVNEALQRVLERFGVVETGGAPRASRLQPGHRGARGEESRCAE